MCFFTLLYKKDEATGGLKLHNEELHTLCFWHSIVVVMVVVVIITT